MNKRKMVLTVLSAASLAAVASSLVLASANAATTLRVQGNEKTYTVTIDAEALSRGYILTSLGNRLSLESDGVSYGNGVLEFGLGAYLRTVDPINGSKTIAMSAPSFTNADKLTLSSGYGYNDYGAAVYLTQADPTAETYFRTYFQFSSDKSPVTVASFSITYTCETHYGFTPVMESVTQSVNVGEENTYGGLTYENGVLPNLDEVDIQKDRFTLTVPENGDPVYSIHPVAKFYDKGGCLIKQAEGFWLVHVNPILRFYTAKDQFEVFAFEYDQENPPMFDLSELETGVLSGFDWREYSLTTEQKADSGIAFENMGDGFLTKPLTMSMDLYPRVTINANPGAYSSEEYDPIVFTPNPLNPNNYGFPAVPAPKTVSDAYHFSYWLNGEERYDPATASDFHDYDLYAEYTSEFDLRLKFINRGFHNAYYEVGLPNDPTPAEPFLLPGDESYIDQSTYGLALGGHIDPETGASSDKGYLVYPQGHREDAVFMEVGDPFINDGKGTLENPAVYVAEPFTYYSPVGMFDYFHFSLPFRARSGGDYVGPAYKTIEYYEEHKYYDGVNDRRTYFKKAALPDLIWNDNQWGLTYAALYGGAKMNSIVPMDYGEDSKSCGIINTKELEVLVGDELFQDTGYYGFMNNAALKRLEHFPSLDTINEYAFWGCESLEPLQNWVDCGAISAIKAHAFDRCFTRPVLDSKGNKSRRDFRFPASVRSIGDYAFKSAVYTDFDLQGDLLTSLSGVAFAYDNAGGHSDDFGKVLAQYNAADEASKPLYEASLKAVANHVIFHGSQAEYEALAGAYDELSTLLASEYYVTFTE